MYSVDQGHCRGHAPQRPRWARGAGRQPVPPAVICPRVISISFRSYSHASTPGHPALFRSFMIAFSAFEVSVGGPSVDSDPLSHCPRWRARTSQHCGPTIAFNSPALVVDAPGLFAAPASSGLVSLPECAVRLCWRVGVRSSQPVPPCHERFPHLRFSEADAVRRKARGAPRFSRQRRFFPSLPFFSVLHSLVA